MAAARDSLSDSEGCWYSGANEGLRPIVREISDGKVRCSPSPPDVDSRSPSGTVHPRAKGAGKDKSCTRVDVSRPRSPSDCTVRKRAEVRSRSPSDGRVDTGFEPHYRLSSDGRVHTLVEGRSSSPSDLKVEGPFSSSVGFGELGTQLVWHPCPTHGEVSMADISNTDAAVEEVLETCRMKPFYIIQLPAPTVMTLCFISVLFVAVVPFILWPSADQPVVFVWKTSILLCVYMFFWIISLSDSMGVISVLACIMLIAAMAVITNDHLSPICGMAVMYMDTISTAGLLGYALADNRQCFGIDQSAVGAAAVAARNKNLNEEQLKRKEEVKFCIALLAIMWTLVCGSRALYLCHSTASEISYIILELSMMSTLCLFFLANFVLQYLIHGALISEDTIATLPPVGVILLLMLSCLLFDLFGTAAAVFIYWLAAMGMAGLFGYSLSIRQNYMKLNVHACKVQRQ